MPILFRIFSPHSHSILRVLQNIETREREKEREWKISETIQVDVSQITVRLVFLIKETRFMFLMYVFNYFSQCHYCYCYNLRVIKWCSSCGKDTYLSTREIRTGELLT